MQPTAPLDGGAHPDSQTAYARWQAQPRAEASGSGSIAAPPQPEITEPDLQASRAILESSDQTLLVLAGLPGVGKSTFAHALVAVSQAPGWVGRKWARTSQDDSRSGRRQEVEDDVRMALARGDNVVVDRVDFNPQQRSHFVEIAMQHTPRPRIRCLVLTASDKTLRERLEARIDHPTLRDPAQAIGVLGRMRRDWEAPRAGEGFERILTLRESDTPPAWGGDEILDVLQRLDKSHPPRNRGHRGGHGFGHPHAHRGRGAPNGFYRGRGAPRGGMRGGPGGALGPPSYGARPWVPQPARDAAPTPW